jgi:GntR family transcriptional regulator
LRENRIKYLEIYEELKRQIVNGDYPVGEPFPTEPDLQRQYSVSRITVRHATRLLADEGYIRAIHGVGTIVISQKESLQLQNLLGFSEEKTDCIYHASLISFEENINATPLICSKLDLPKASKINYYARLRWENNIPIGIQKTYTPDFLSVSKEELEKPHTSLYQLFREKGFVVTRGNETIEAIAADEALAELLKVPVNSPLLYVQRVTKDQLDRTIEYAEIFYRGDRYRYNIQLRTP